MNLKRVSYIEIPLKDAKDDRVAVKNEYLFGARRAHN